MKKANNRKINSNDSRMKLMVPVLLLILLVNVIMVTTIII